MVGFKFDVLCRYVSIESLLIFKFDALYRYVSIESLLIFKFDALYRYVSIESLLKSWGGGGGGAEVCIGGWSGVCQPYIEIATSLSE